jgi:hypothetical protein
MRDGLRVGGAGPRCRLPDIGGVPRDRGEGMSEDSAGPRFSARGVHNSTCADDFSEHARGMRREILAHPEWRPMTQYGRHLPEAVVPDRQNGLIARGLLRDDGVRVPSCRAFLENLRARAAELCDMTGVTAGPGLSVDVNAMAYGAGAWLSPHRDHDESEARPNLVAWILYLTNPADGEWTDEKGGALALADPSGRIERVRPRFNRFAMFKVSKSSVHEIEPVTWDGGWEGCRLALSGWIRGPEVRVPTPLRVYAKSPDARMARAQQERELEGFLAMYRLMRQQQAFCGRDTAETEARLAQYELELAAHRAAPPGTVFRRFAPGPDGCVLVLDEGGSPIYLGARDGVPGS